VENNYYRELEDVIMANIIKIDVEEEIECPCGNRPYYDGFFPCDENGILDENADTSWGGYYKCDRCDQIYLPNWI
jgi:hypothetical protein